MNTTLAMQPSQGQALAIEAALVGGDLKDLNPQGRIDYYNALCQSLKLNPLTKPFAYITLNGKLTLYALKDCTEQLRKINGVSITNVDPKQVGDLLVVVASAKDRDGRVDSSTGAVSIGALKGEALANAMMKCETKAKRRVTLSLCGLGFLDETEVDTLRDQGIAKDAPLMTTDSHGNMVPVPPKQSPKEEFTAQLQASVDSIKPQAVPVVGSEKVFIGEIGYHTTKPNAKSKGGAPYIILKGSSEGDSYYVWDTTFFATAEANLGRTLTLTVKTDAKGRKSIAGGLEPIGDSVERIDIHDEDRDPSEDRVPF